MNSILQKGKGKVRLERRSQDCKALLTSWGEVRIVKVVVLLTKEQASKHNTLHRVKQFTSVSTSPSPNLSVKE